MLLSCTFTHLHLYFTYTHSPVPHSHIPSGWPMLLWQLIVHPQHNSIALPDSSLFPSLTLHCLLIASQLHHSTTSYCGAWNRWYEVKCMYFTTRVCWILPKWVCFWLHPVTLPTCSTMYRSMKPSTLLTSLQWLKWNEEPIHQSTCIDPSFLLFLSLFSLKWRVKDSYNTYWTSATVTTSHQS